VAKSCITVCFTYSLRMAIFLNTDISQESVATRLGCGGVFIYHFVTNFLLSLTVKEFWKSVNIWWSCGQELGVLFFFDSQCIWWYHQTWPCPVVIAKINLVLVFGWQRLSLCVEASRQERFLDGWYKWPMIDDAIMSLRLKRRPVRCDMHDNSMNDRYCLLSVKYETEYTLAGWYQSYPDNSDTTKTSEHLRLMIFVFFSSRDSTC